MEMNDQLHERGKSLGACWTADWVGPRVGLDAGVKRKSLFSAAGGNRNPVIQPVT